MRLLTVPAAAVLLLSSSLAAQRSSPARVADPDLERLRVTLDSAAGSRPFDYNAYMALADSLRPRLFALIEADRPWNAGEFLVASRLAYDPVGFFENRRVEHEMALMAFVLGDSAAWKRLALTWDGLNRSLGRGQRLGSYTREGVALDMDPVPAPAAVRAVFKDLAAARARAAGRTNDPELQRLRDADQADRADPIDQAKMERMHVQDPLRRARVLALLDSGVPATGRDFQNAATVLQHGHEPTDFMLAHELSLAAYALGDTTALWLIARSYDRMLLHLGHRQRLATQFHGVTLEPMDNTAMNDRIRVALGGRSLRDVRAGAHP
jgi:hypothetical protein